MDDLQLLLLSGIRKLDSDIDLFPVSRLQFFPGAADNTDFKNTTKGGGAGFPAKDTLRLCKI